MLREISIDSLFYDSELPTTTIPAKEWERLHREEIQKLSFSNTILDKEITELHKKGIKGISIAKKINVSEQFVSFRIQQLKLRSK